MRVCLSSIHPRVLSGQIDSLAGLGRALERRGHDVRLVAPFDTTELLTRDLTELDDGPKGLLGAAREMLATIPRIVEAAAGCDLVHLALPTPGFAWLGDLVQARTQAPTVVGFEGHLVAMHDLLSACHRPSAITSYLPLWALNNALVGRLSGYRCPAYVVSSQYQAAELGALGVAERRVAILPNVVEDGKLRGCEPWLARRRLGLLQTGRIVGYMGHFNDVKGVDVLAEAFRLLAERDPETMLVLAWSGQGDRQAIERRLAGVESSVVWLNKVHVGTFLCAVDVLALPYRSTAGQGAFPSLVLEALRAGCPLVTTDLPLLDEITSLGPVARTCAPERPNELAERLAELLASEPDRRAMAQAQRRVARTHFTPDALAPLYERFYAAVLGTATRLERVA